MKKLVTLILSVIMVLSMTVAASAVFVASPSLNGAPVLEEVKGGESNLIIKVTAYKDRATLDADTKAALEDSYKDIQAASTVADLTDAIKAVADKAGIKVADLKISDLFDVSVAEGETKDEITIVLKAETLKNFVALLHDKDGKWEVVDGAKVSGNKLTFSVDSLSPFAIVVNSGEDKDSPATGNPTDYGMYFVIAAVVFGGVAALFLAKSKKRVND